MKIGYLRVSTEEQRPDRQIDALEPICDELHIERLSACAKRRPIYEQVTEALQPGQSFVIWDLDRAYRSAKDALIQLDALHARGIEIEIASLGIDTATPHGKLIYTVVSALAEFERHQLSERTKQGMEAARRRGKRIGRPPKLSINDIEWARAEVQSKGLSKSLVARKLSVDVSTVARALRPETLG